MSNQFNYNKYISEVILEVEKELEEETTTGDAAGYNIPGAFSAGREKDKKKQKSVATQAGYEIVNESMPSKKYRSRTLIQNLTPKKQKIINQLQKKFSDYKIYYLNNIGKALPVIYRLNKTDLKGAYTLVIIGYDTNGDDWNSLSKIVDTLLKENINEARKIKEVEIPKKKNRWLELKNDETMHTNKKLAKGMMKLRNELQEVEKFLGWYNKLKNVNETEATSYWKRTNTNIRKIKERIVNIARTLQELEK